MEWARRAVRLKRAHAAFSDHRPLALALAGILALFAGACRGPQRTEPVPDPVAGPSVQPVWVGQPLSWQKLDAIESWLVESAHEHDPGLRLEGMLELNEGRLEFSRRDLESGARVDGGVRTRLAQAVLGFEAVVADEHASSGQLARARAGADSARSLLTGRGTATLVVVPRSVWGARPARRREMTPLRGQWNRLTVHHSAQGADAAGALQDSSATLQRIQKVHMDRSDPDHGWADIGYHFLIDSSGRIFEGRELAWQGAHARGANNHQNIGVCLLGDYSRRAPSRAALRSLELLLDDLRQRFRISAARVYKHKELTATDCPGPALSAWVERYRSSGRART